MLKLFIANLKMIVRNKQALFWTLMFPLMFTVIFGLFFGRDNNVAGSIAIFNQSSTTLASGLEKSLTDSGLFTIKKETNLDTAKDLVKKNTISAILIIPEGFGDMKPGSSTQVTIYNDPANAQTNAALNGFVSNFLTATNFQLQNAKPIYSIAEEKTNQRKLNYFDFVLAGVLGLALMNSSIIGIAVGMTKYRQDKILKRITATPLKSWKFVLAEVLSRLIVNMMQIAIILIVGAYGFNAHIYGNIPLIFLLSLVGGILFQLIGFVIASISKTTQAAEGMATAITIPMMFLSGVFFPIDALPKWLSSIVQYLPLAPLLRILRSVALDAASPFLNSSDLIIVSCWIIGCLIFAAYKFRLAEE